MQPRPDGARGPTDAGEAGPYDACASVAQLSGAAARSNRLSVQPIRYGISGELGSTSGRWGHRIPDARRSRPQYAGVSAIRSIP